MKVKTIKVTNLKAVSDETANFDGCSAIIVAGNNKGKTTLIRGLIDRFRSEKPEIILKKGEQKGNYLMELTDESKIEWNFTEKSESFSFTTKEGIKMTTGVISAINEKYFGKKFDIDKFLQSTPKIQSSMLAELVGLDFTEIDNRYKIAYEERTDANKEVSRLRAMTKKEPEKIEKPDIEALKKEKVGIDNENTKLRDQWKIDNEKHQNEIQKFNEDQNDLSILLNYANKSRDILRGYETTLFGEFIDFKGIEEKIKSLSKPQEKKLLTSLPEPEYKSLSEVEKKIEAANEQRLKFDNYSRDLADYESWVKEEKEAAEKAKKCDENVKSIEAEKRQIIATAKIPAEFFFTDDGILYNGLPLSNAQISSSGKYIAALKLGAMCLGELKMLHFDASFLDKNSLTEVEAWANENDLQLLIERPDFDGGKIKYVLL